MEAPTKHAVIYCRVSTKEQAEEGNSLVTQEKNCRDYATKHGYEIDHVFIEQGESAKTADRTELQKLFRFCANKKNQVSVVISYKIDRISRNTDDYSQIRILLKRYGVEIKSTSEYFEDTPAGRFMENIIANVAQFDNDVRTERSVGGMLQAVREGRYVWNAPIGYVNGKVKGKSNIIQNDFANLVKQTFEEVAQGTKSIQEVRFNMVLKGLCNRNGQPLCKSYFYNFLKNEIYAGWINVLGERNKGSYEAIISEELFRRVQRRIKSRKISRSYLMENPDFPLRRFICSPDGGKLTGYWAQGRNKKYPYYRLSKPRIEFKKELLENHFVSFIDQFAIPKKNFTVLKKRLRDGLKSRVENIKTIHERLKQKESALIDKKQLLIDKNLSGVISDSIFQEQMEKVESELWETKRLLENKDPVDLSDSLIMDELSDFLISPGEYWKNQPFEIKKKLQRFEFPDGVIFDGTEFRTNRICSIFKLKELFFSEEFSDVHSRGRYFEQSHSSKSPPLLSSHFISLWPELQKELTILRSILSSEKEKEPSNPQLLPAFDIAA